jgi:hypothetical protein
MRSAVVPWHHMTLIMWWKGLLISHKSNMECHIVIVGRGSGRVSMCLPCAPFVDVLFPVEQSAGIDGLQIVPLD